MKLEFDVVKSIDAQKVKESEEIVREYSEEKIIDIKASIHKSEKIRSDFFIVSTLAFILCMIAVFFYGCAASSYESYENTFCMFVIILFVVFIILVFVVYPAISCHISKLENLVEDWQNAKQFLENIEKLNECKFIKLEKDKKEYKIFYIHPDEPNAVKKTRFPKSKSQYLNIEKTEIHITCSEFEGLCILDVKEPYEER